MRLNIMTSNVLHKQLAEENNIIYYTSNSLFDHIIYLLDNNYFVFADTPSVSENCRCLPESYMDMYDYDTCCSNGVVTYKDRSNLTSAMHLSSLFLEHNYKASNLKKEDLYIINQNLKRSKKIFFHRSTAETWKLDNSIVIEYGIPVDLFKPLESIPEKDVLISGNNETIAGQLYSHITNALKLKADTIETLAFANINQVNELFNNYKVYLNIGNSTVDSLCAASSGLDVLALAQRDPSDTKANNTPSVKNCANISELVSLVDDRAKNYTKNNNANIYIKNNYSFDKFKAEMQGIFDTVKREACLL